VAAKLSDVIREEVELAELRARLVRLKDKVKKVRKAIARIKTRWYIREVKAAERERRK
jgi:hypothetical protein